MASETEEDAARIIIGEEHFPALDPTSRILGKWGRVEVLGLWRRSSCCMAKYPKSKTALTFKATKVPVRSAEGKNRGWLLEKRPSSSTTKSMSGRHNSFVCFAETPIHPEDSRPPWSIQVLLRSVSQSRLEYFVGERRSVRTSSVRKRGKGEIRHGS